MVNPVDRPTARRIRDALEATGANGTVRLKDGVWIFRVFQGAPAADRDEWSVRLADHISHATGLRLQVEFGDEFHR